MNDDLIYGLLVHLGRNMWNDAEAADHLRCDMKVWNDITEHLAECQGNVLVIDIGEALAYPSHPELAVSDSWTADRMKDEIARLSDKNAAKGDIVRLCQRLGTDYMVVGDVRFASVQAPGVNPVTGQAMSAAPQRFAEIGYRVILAPTGEIAWADTVTVDTTDVPAADLLSFVSLSTDCAARRIAEGVEANLLSRTSACGGSCGSAEASGCPSGASAVPPSGTSVRGTGNGGIVTPF